MKGLEDLIKPGISTKDIDDYVEAVTKKHGMRAAEKATADIQHPSAHPSMTR